MDLSPSEREFLQRGGRSADDVYDSRGKPKAVWQKEAKRLEKELVLGVPCRKGGHRLRTRYGDCVQCNPHKITFQMRHQTPGYVYIAGSIQKSLIKVGYADDPGERERSLRAERNAGCSDWEMLFHVKAKDSAKLENELLRKLSSYKVDITFLKNGRQQQASEVRRCSFSQAHQALLELLDQSEHSERVLSNRSSLYEFKPIKQPSLAPPKKAEAAITPISPPAPSLRRPLKPSWWRQLAGWIRSLRAA